MLDRAVLRNLTLRFRLGTFDPPELVPYTRIPSSVVGCKENLALARSCPHTRLPLVDGDLDHVVGTIHLKELLWALNDQGGRLDLRDLARPALLVPEMRLIQDLLLDFQQQKQHLAMVVNEHGGVDGLA